MKPILVKGLCKFCESPEKVPVLTKNGVAICLKCLHIAGQAAHMRTIDAITCDHCQTDAGFTLVYPRFITIRFERDGTDQDSITVYKVVETKGNYKAGENPLSVSCGHCKKSIRFWIATRNKYVSNFFTEQFVDKL